jgi:uncharacterized protein YbjQ (UPF0145 family)
VIVAMDSTHVMAAADSAGLAIVALAYLLPLLVLLFACVIGVIVERRHFASIRLREAATGRLPAVTTRTLQEGRAVADARLVTASVVISHDHFKRLLANLRKIFGGRLGAYETLLERARREAILRLKEQSAGAHLIVNLRLETCTIARTKGRQGIGAVEVLAYGTAVRYA